MIYTNDYESPLGNILLAGDEQGRMAEYLFFRPRPRVLSKNSFGGLRFP